MIRLWGLLLALAVAALVAVGISSAFQSVTQNLAGHGPSSADVVELGAPGSGRGDDLKGRGHRSRHAKSSKHCQLPVLLQVRGGCL